MAVALLDFFNSRDDAILLWAVVIFGYAALKGAGIGAAVLDVVRASLAPKLLLLFASAVAYNAALVLAAEKLGLWHTTALKETIYWFLGSGIVLAGSATHASPADPGYLKKLGRQALRLTILIEFVVNLYVFPFVVELVLVLLVFLFVGMQVVAQHDETTDARVRKFIDGVLMTVGVGLLVYFGVKAITDLEGLLTRENGEDLLVVPLMTLAYVPFLCAVAWLSRREQENLRQQSLLRDPPGRGPSLSGVAIPWTSPRSPPVGRRHLP